MLEAGQTFDGIYLKSKTYTVTKNTTSTNQLHTANCLF